MKKLISILKDFYDFDDIFYAKEILLRDMKKLNIKTSEKLKLGRGTDGIDLILKEIKEIIAHWKLIFDRQLLNCMPTYVAGNLSKLPTLPPDGKLKLLVDMNKKLDKLEQLSSPSHFLRIVNHREQDNGNNYSYRGRVLHNKSKVEQSYPSRANLKITGELVPEQWSDLIVNLDDMEVDTITDSKQDCPVDANEDNCLKEYKVYMSRRNQMKKRRFDRNQKKITI